MKIEIDPSKKVDLKIGKSVEFGEPIRALSTEASTAQKEILAQPAAPGDSKSEGEEIQTRVDGILTLASASPMTLGPKGATIGLPLKQPPHFYDEGHVSREVHFLYKPKPENDYFRKMERNDRLEQELKRLNERERACQEAMKRSKSSGIPFFGMY